MNSGTKQNILTQLGMSSDAYNLVNTVYYVKLAPEILESEID
jgi:hypothetical protein